MNNEIHVDDFGTRHEIEVNVGGVPFDISAATVKTIRYRKPDETYIDKTANFINDGADAMLLYTFEEGFIDQHGTWKYQVFLDFPTGEWRSTIEEFEVLPNL